MSGAARGYTPSGRSAWRISSFILIAFLGGQARETRLEELIETGLARNPGLAAQRQAVETAAIDTLLSSTAINPHLETEAMHNVTAPDRPTAGVRLSKEFRPGFRARAQRSARRSLAAVEAWTRAEELKLVEAIRLAWVDWQIQDRKLVLQQEVRQRWEALARLVEDQMAQGRLSELDLAEARLNAVKARQREIALRNEKLAAARRLQTLAGLDFLPEPVMAPGLDSLPALPALDTLQSWGRARSAVLAALEKEVEARTSQVALEQGPPIPEFNLSIGYEREIEGYHLVGGGIELPLPLFNRNQGGIAKAESALRESRLRVASAQAELGADIAAFHARLSSLAERHGQYRDQVRDLVRKQLRLSESGFRQGLLGVFDLSRVQAEVLAQEEEALELLESYHREWNRLGKAVGGKIW